MVTFAAARLGFCRDKKRRYVLFVGRGDIGTAQRPMWYLLHRFSHLCDSCTFLLGGSVRVPLCEPGCSLADGVRSCLPCLTLNMWTSIMERFVPDFLMTSTWRHFPSAMLDDPALSCLPELPWWRRPERLHPKIIIWLQCMSPESNYFSFIAWLCA